MRQYTAKSVIIIASLLLGSCLATQPAQHVSALLEQSSADTRLVLENAIGELMNSQPVKLADNVFLQKSIVIIERRQPKDSRGNLLDGREVRQADTISLHTEDGKCYLRHDQSVNIKLVDNISCKAK